MSYNHHLNAPVAVRVPRMSWGADALLLVLNAGYSYENVERDRGRVTLVHVTSLPRTSEREGLAGLEASLKALAPWAVEGEYSVTDENDQTVTVTLP